MLRDLVAPFRNVWLLGACMVLQATSPVSAAEDGTMVYSLPPGTLARLQARIATNDASIKPALDALLREADTALKSKPLSVVDKPEPGASGDKHDYVSYAPYWWPDPKKPDGLPYIRKDGHRNPASGGDRSDAPRLGRTCNTAFTLALAHRLTGTDRYAEHSAKLLRTFFLDPATRMNPNFDQAQAVPGVNTGRGTGMIESRSLTAACDAAILLHGSKSWTAEDDAGLKRWMESFLDWALTSKNGREERAARNNHATYYDVQVVHLALFVGRTNLARQIVDEARTKRMPVQFRPDGTQPEELDRADSFGYSRFNLEAWFDLATLGDHVGVDLWRFETKDGASLRKTFDYLFQFVADPGRPWPHASEKPPRRSLDSGLLRQAATGFREPSYLKLLERDDRPATARDALFF
jgi:hypothetical protein